MRNVRYLLLASVLWFVQVALLVHAADLDAHNAAEPCQICLHATPLDGAVTASTVAAVVGIPGCERIAEPLCLLVAYGVERPNARGPPIFFA